jgi:chromosome segregation ATPase
LHLAVESGAAPEVVNLVLVANWSGIVARDNSGRTPMDILAQGELLLLDDYRIVYESLMRCHKTYVDIQQKAQDEKTEIKKKHNGQMTTLQRQHQEVLKQETEKFTVLMMHLEAREVEIDQMKKIGAAKDTLLSEAHNEIVSWKREVHSLTATISTLQDELANYLKHIDTLEHELQEREKDIDGRDEFIDRLSNDLREISAVHEQEISESVLATEMAMRAMVSSQIVLQKHLSEQGSNITSLLRIRGIDCLPDQKSDSADNCQEEKEEHPHDCGEVAASLKAAAMSALTPSTTC